MDLNLLTPLITPAMRRQVEHEKAMAKAQAKMSSRERQRITKAQKEILELAEAKRALSRLSGGLNAKGPRTRIGQDGKPKLYPGGRALRRAQAALSARQAFHRTWPRSHEANHEHKAPGSMQG